MKSLLFFLAVSLSISFVFGQQKAYQIYNSKGKKVRYKKMIKTLRKQNIILFGEQHNNPICHWLQYEVTHELNKTNSLILGAEMIESDNQTVLNSYLKQTINYAELDSLARLWGNHKTDYAPLVDLAKQYKLPFIATNIPRKYANLVYKKGFKALDSLSLEEKSWIAPLPIPFDSELVTYKEILTMMGNHGSPLLVEAQASKDATMAYFILKNYKKDHLFIHYNGAYHSDKYEGILWYLKRERKDLHYYTISTVSQKNTKKLLPSNKHIADFIICIDEDMTTTY